MRRNVWIAIPAYTGQIHLPTMRSVLTDFMGFHNRGDAVTIFDESGNAMIADCRAVIVAQFLASDATDLIFVDSDVVWEAGTLLKLVDASVDFVAAIYPQRKDPINYCVSWLDKPDLVAENGLLEVDGVPAGCMKLSRSMLERMIERYPETKFHCETAPDNTAYALFDSYRIGNLKFGEDYSFCKRWRDMGGKVWIDPEIKMGHVGFKTFEGHLGNWLRNR